MLIIKQRNILFISLALVLLSSTSFVQADELASETYGTTSSGQVIKRYTLKNRHGITVKFLDFGAIINEVITPDRKGHMANIVLGFATLADYEKYNNDIHFGALLGRYANRIAKGQFSLDGKNYTLTINDPPNTLHSGPDNFGVKHWLVKPVAFKNGQAAELTYVSPAGEAGFPGTLTTHVTYSLDNDNNFRITYEATTDAPTFVNLTNHTYFNLSGEAAGSTEQHKIMIAASHYLPTDAGSIPTGELAKVDGTPFDLRKPTAIGQHLRDGHAQILNAGGYDKTFVLDKKEKALGLAARVSDPASGRVLELSTTQPGVQFYSANGLHGNIAGTSGKAYRQADAFALETQHYPDAPNQPKFPSTLLKPGETYHEEAVFHFGVEK